MVKLQFTSTNSKLIANPAKKMSITQIATSSMNEVGIAQTNLNADTLLGPIQDFINNVYSNQQTLLDKIENLENKVENINKTRLLIFSNEENTDEAVKFFIEVMSKFNEFYVEHV